MKQKTLNIIKQFVSRQMAHTPDKFHGFEHARNVASNVALLWSLLPPNQAEKVDLNLLQACAYLHDFHTLNHPASFKNFLFETQLVRQTLPQVLNQLPLTPKERQLIYQTVLHHPLAFPFHRLNRQNSLYSQLLQDADFLDQFNPQRLQLLRLENKSTLFHRLKTFLINFNRPNTVRWLIKHFSNRPNLTLQAYNYLWHQFQYIESGNQTKPTVLFLHGYADSAYTFLPTITQLANDYHLLALELPFHQKRSVYHLNELLDYISAFLDSKQLQTTKITLAGFSLGGLIATHYANRHPQRVKRLILLNSVPLPANRFFRLIANTLFYFLKIPFVSKLITYLNLNFFSAFQQLQHDWFSTFNLKNFSQSIHKTTLQIIKDTLNQTDNSLLQLKRLGIEIQAVLFADDKIISSKQAHIFNQLEIPLSIFPTGGHADNLQIWNLALIQTLTNRCKH